MVEGLLEGVGVGWGVGYVENGIIVFIWFKLMLSFKNKPRPKVEAL